MKVVGTLQEVIRLLQRRVAALERRTEIPPLLPIARPLAPAFFTSPEHQKVTMEVARKIAPPERERWTSGFFDGKTRVCHFVFNEIVISANGDSALTQFVAIILM